MQQSHLLYLSRFKMTVIVIVDLMSTYSICTSRNNIVNMDPMKKTIL